MVPLPIEKVKEYCLAYEKKIDKLVDWICSCWGLDVPVTSGSTNRVLPVNSITRLVKLDPLTITDAAKDFIKEEYVPLRALTMGVGSIMKARKILLMAWGEGKAKILQKTVEGKISDEVPASFLQQHKNVKVVVDQWAAMELTRIKTPWLVGHVHLE